MSEHNKTFVYERLDELHNQRNYERAAELVGSVAPTVIPDSIRDTSHWPGSNDLARISPAGEKFAARPYAGRSLISLETS